MSKRVALFGYVAWTLWIAYHYFWCSECRFSDSENQSDRQLAKWQQQAAPGCMRYGSEEDCDPACADWCALEVEEAE